MPRSSAMRMTMWAMLALFLFVPAAAANAALYGSWPGLPTIGDPGDDAGGGAKDITGIWYAKDATNNYFRMDVAGAISAGDHANSYGIYITTTPPGSGIPASSSLVTTLAFDFGGSLITAASFTPQGGTSVSIPYEISLDRKTLEWSIPLSNLSGFFYFLGGTITGSTVNDVTSAAGTPIPSAAWLLGTGLVGLVVLRRRTGKLRDQKSR